MTDTVKIDARELAGVRLSEDGARVTLTVIDRNGQSVSLSLPANCLNAVMTAVPRRVETGDIHKLDSWSLGAADNGVDLLLTLRTAEAVSVSFTLKPWQIEGMATIATHGGAHRTAPRTLH